MTSILSREHRHLKQVKHLILPFEYWSARSDSKEGKHQREMFAKTYLRKIGAPMTNTTTEKLGAKRSLTYQRLHLSIPQKGRAEKPPKNKKLDIRWRNTRITKKREGGERGGGGLSESRAQSSFAKLKSKRHSSLDCRKLLFIKLHSTYSPAAPTKYAFATVYSTHLSSILSREHRQLQQVKQMKHLMLPFENWSARSDSKERKHQQENVRKNLS